MGATGSLLVTERKAICLASAEWTRPMVRSERSSAALRLYRRYLRGPDHPAKLRVIRRLERVLIGEAGAVFAVDAGFDMLLHPRDQVEYKLIQIGSYEPTTLSFMKQNLTEGQTALLAGVNIGLHAMVCSRVVGRDGRVIGVEPQPGTLNRARANFMLNKLPNNIALVAGALGAAPDTIPMGAAPVENTGWSSLVLRDAGQHPFYVSVISVPELLRRLGVRNVDLMLLDVEGYELQVLSSMRGGPLPGLLLLEIHPIVLKETNTAAADYHEAVRSLGYQCFDFWGRPATPGGAICENNLVCVLGGQRRVIWLDRSNSSESQI